MEKLNKDNSISDSETSIRLTKKSAKSSESSIQDSRNSRLTLEMSNFPLKRTRDNQNQRDQEMGYSTDGIREFESLGGLNGGDQEHNLSKYPNQRRVTCANSDEIKSKLMAKRNIQPYSLEHLPNQKMSPTTDKASAWPEFENSKKSHIKASSNPLIDSDENSLYLNIASSTEATNLANSSSQTFQAQINKTSFNNAGAKPERLFSTRLLNQRTQNAVLNSTKIDCQNQAKTGGTFDSEGSEKQNLADAQDSQGTYESNNPPAPDTVASALKDSNQIGTTAKNLNKMTEKRNNEKNDGTMSDSALTNPMNNLPETANKKRRPSMAKALVILGLSKKSNSASNLTSNKRFGFARSEEYGMLPELRNRNLSPSSADEEKKPRLWSGVFKLPHEKPFNEFIENLGPGQIVSRQVLGLPCLGEIKLEMSVQNQKLTIQVFEVKKLKPKIGHRILPNVYIKFYLYNGVLCTEKQKTSTQRRTLNPVYNETLRFESDYMNKILQLTVWGDYGKLDKKVFMGIVQIGLDDCRLTERVIGWYKLYPASSIITNFSSIASANDFSQAESGYSISSQKMVK
ncbi:regulating synaptic membrane exocytosis 2-like isoform X2 [Brachionus plicatilis]|uniref:Regulating synaptic membrane exocytosis 2-like isoform X2 n=1 Tax=Brachionus plicatilis TaxID=10195 RepID=A0A3M7RIN6_BRAPC|nr:regulating synaptic membrane exocytosis 2-like isoform X2 [Brachionus plicatilis]